jgi:hypothetical protein
MSDTTHVDPVLPLLLTVLISGGIGSLFPALYNALISRGLEQEKRLAALKTRVKKLLRGKAANADPQEFEDLADELDELAQLIWVLKRRKRTKNDREVTNVDVLEAADMLRKAGSAAPGTDDRMNLRELIEKLRIRLSPNEEQLVQTAKK